MRKTFELRYDTITKHGPGGDEPAFRACFPTRRAATEGAMHALRTGAIWAGVVDACGRGELVWSGYANARDLSDDDVLRLGEHFGGHRPDGQDEYAEGLYALADLRRAHPSTGELRDVYDVKELRKQYSSFGH